MPVKRGNIYEMTNGSPKQRRTYYLRSALIKIFKMSPGDIEAYQSKTGFEEAAKKMYGMATTSKYPVQTWAQIQDTLGEKIGSNWKATMDELEDEPQITNDLPMPER